MGGFKPVYDETAPDKPGPDFHAERGMDVARGYLNGAFLVGPQMLGNPWLPLPVLENLALRRFRAILRYARQAVPFYGAYQVDPDDIQTRADLLRVPVLTKALLRQHRDALEPPPERRRYLIRAASSGSSGVPTASYFDPLRDLPRRLQIFRVLNSHGIRPWHKALVFDHFDQRMPKRFLLQRLGLMRREVFPWWKREREAIAYINDSRPDVLNGILSSFRLMALAVRKHGGLRHHPKVILTKGELLDPHTRALIESTFQAPVADYYATEEIGIIAWQCPKAAHYHIDADLVMVETLREDGAPTAPGELGEIVLSNLYNRTMPYLRYRQGDLGELGDDKCECGRGLPVLRRLIGRKMDLLITPDGTLHHPFAVTVLVEQIPGIARYCITQVERDRLSIEVVWDDQVPDGRRRSHEDALRRALLEVLGGDMRIDFATVEAAADDGFVKKAPLVKGLPGVQLDELVAGSYNIRF